MLFVYILVKFKNHQIMVKKYQKIIFGHKFIIPKQLIFVGFESKNANLKIPINFLFTFGHISKQTADCVNKVKSLE